MQIKDIPVPEARKEDSMDLTQQQFIELTEFLGESPSNYGEWHIIPSCKFPTCINNLGTMVIRFACSYVTSDGQHRNMNTTQYRFSNMGHGYLRCKLGGIHRLVAEAFLPTWDFNLQVNHIDGNKHNNHVNNLEMVTAQENINHYLTEDCFVDVRKNQRAGISKGLLAYYSGHGSPMIGKHYANKSPILGKKWVHKDKESLLVSPTDLAGYLQLGYEMGAYISDERHKKLVVKNLCNSYAKGAVRTQSFRDNLSERMKGNTYSRGYHHTEEAKQKISAVHKGMPKSEETRRKLSEAKKGKPMGAMSDSTKSKISKSHCGKIWIHNILTKEMKQITSEQLDEYLSIGYARGMK